MNTLQSYILESLLDDDDTVISRGHDRASHTALLDALDQLRNRGEINFVNSDRDGEWKEDDMTLPLLNNSELRFWSKKHPSYSSELEIKNFDVVRNLFNKYGIEKLSVPMLSVNTHNTDFSKFPEICASSVIINGSRYRVRTLKINELNVTYDSNITTNNTVRVSKHGIFVRTVDKLGIYGDKVDLQNCMLDIPRVEFIGCNEGLYFKNVRSTAKTLAIHDTFILDADYSEFCKKLSTLFDMNYTFSYKDTRTSEVVTFKSKLFKKLLAWFKNKKYISTGEVPYRFNSIKFTDILDISGFTDSEFRLYIHDNDICIAVTKNLKIAQEYKRHDMYHWFSSVDIPKTVDGYYIVIIRDPR